MIRNQLEKIVKYLDMAVEELVKQDHHIPEKVYNNLASAIALIENELTLEDDIEEIDYHKAYISCADEEEDADA